MDFFCEKFTCFQEFGIPVCSKAIVDQRPPAELMEKMGNMKEKDGRNKERKRIREKR